MGFYTWHSKVQIYILLIRLSKNPIAWILSRNITATAAAKSLQSCSTLCDPKDGSPPGSPVPGILQARTLEWVAISFSNAWKWKWSCSAVSNPQWPHGLQPTRLLLPWDFLGRSTGVGCHCLLRETSLWICKKVLALSSAEKKKNLETTITNALARSNPNTQIKISKYLLKGNSSEVGNI